MEAPKVWYFAYGSNMRSSVLANRGLKPAAAKRVVVPSYVLTFDVFGVPYSEPAMASIAKRSAPSYGEPTAPPGVQGIAYLVSGGEYALLVISEGAGIAYQEVELEAHVLTSDEDEGLEGEKTKIRVRTLVARYPFRPNAAPSARYLNLLIQGAEEHGLPSSYQDYLRSLPRFDRERDLSRRGQMGATIFLSFWPRLIGYLMRWIKTRAGKNSSSQSPLWMGGLVWALFALMWWYHNTVHGRIWGRGDGREKLRLA